MSTEELDRLAVIRKIVDKRLTQVVAPQQLDVTVWQIKPLVKKYRVFAQPA